MLRHHINHPNHFFPREKTLHDPARNRQRWHLLKSPVTFLDYLELRDYDGKRAFSYSSRE
uniref:Uncharacterized protein n=1 Tax=Timema poppense TaxID=170557 RepID=A0A7R9DUJ8_TIMPO|nr:unnamed protein product [Timema poppensis]